jgi:hypothetical protein
MNLISEVSLAVADLKRKISVLSKIRNVMILIAARIFGNSFKIRKQPNA